MAVELRPLAVSLNSFNGFMTLADGKRLFFKTHIESDGVIDEYYHAALLAEAGYPVLQPIYTVKRSGKQLLVYEVISDPSVFDLAWAIETGASDLLPDTDAGAKSAPTICCFSLYLNSLEWQSARASRRRADSPVVLSSAGGGRLARFYDGTQIALPDGVRVDAKPCVRSRWIINGQALRSDRSIRFDRTGDYAACSLRRRARRSSVTATLTTATSFFAESMRR